MFANHDAMNERPPIKNLLNPYHNSTFFSVPQDDALHSHKKLSFAIINDYKSRKTRLQKRHSDDNMSLSGRYSPYSRYIMQRELSAPALNRMESLDSDDGEFYYVVDENYDEERGRMTSIGFVHNKKEMSASMSNLSRPRPKSEMRRASDPRYMSTPNFIKINKNAVISSTPMEKINPRLVMHRSLKGVLKVYNNTNIRTNRRFTVEGMEIYLPNGKVDPNLLMPIPLIDEDKRSENLKKQQLKADKKKKQVSKRRKLSPIAGTPNRDARDKDEPKTPKKKPNTPKTRLEERLKKDKFGRLVTAKKEALPDLRAKKKTTGKKGDKRLTVAEEAKKVEEELAAEAEKKSDERAISFMQQLQAKNVLGRTLKARLASKQPPPLTKQDSKQSIESFFEDKDKEVKARKSSFSSLRSLSQSIRSVTTFRSNKSNDVEDEAAEMGDEITNLQNVKDAKSSAKSKVKSSILAKTKVMSLTSRLKAGAQKENPVPPPSRSASKTSIFSRSSAKNPVEPMTVDTPTRKSEALRAPSTSSIMSMTTAAITANPLQTTLTITNQLATQGFEKRVAEGHIGTAPVAITEAAVASLPDVDRMSIASQKTITSQKTNTSTKDKDKDKGSRKTSARNSARNSARSSAGRKSDVNSTKSSMSRVVSGINVIRYLRRKKSDDSIKSEKSDALHITSGLGDGADNQDYLAPKILESSKKSLENVQKSVNRATSEIHQTINANLTDLKTLEKKLSRQNLLEPDANNNDVEKGSTKGLSRHSTRLDMAGPSKNMSARSRMNEKDGMSVNAISVAPDGRPVLQHQESEDSNQTNSSTK